MLDLRLTHHFADFTLDAAFSAPAGVTALFGRSGSGKTTIVNALAGLLKPDAGRITMDETILFDSTQKICVRPHQRRIGYVFQDARLFPHLNVRQNLGYGRWFARGEPSSVEVQRIIDLLGLGPLLQRRPGDLSGGEKQRVQLARVLAQIWQPCPGEEQFLVLDEPTSAFDLAHQKLTLDIVRQLAARGVGVVMVLHDLNLAARCADKLVVFDGGLIAAQGSPEEILTEQLIQQVFGVKAIIDRHPTTHKPLVITE